MVGHDHTGRSKTARRRRPRSSNLGFDEQFIALPRSLVFSPAWRAMSSPCRRFVDVLIRTHLAHGGAMNGELPAPYTILQRNGISNRDGRPAIEMAIFLGLVRCTKEGGRLDGVDGAALYALTWLPTTEQSWGSMDYKKVTPADIKAYCDEVRRLKALKAARKQDPGMEI